VAKLRFVFGKDMTEDQMVDAVLQMAKGHGIALIDDRDNRKKKTKKIKKRMKNWRKK
jgi:hypothetical protein